MAKQKLVIHVKQFRVESGGDTGISPMIEYVLVEPDAPAGTGYDLFDINMLAFVQKHFVEMNESKFKFTYEAHGIKQYSRVFAESKRT